MAEDKKEVLYVVSAERAADAPTMMAVPYCPDMQLCDYLRRVLAPRLAHHIAHNGESVFDTFLSRDNATGQRVVFNRENRLLRLGDLVPAGATLHHIALGASSEALMRGNATHGDVTDACSICLDNDTDFELTCHHRFHTLCLGVHLRRAAACPLCRAAIA